MNTITPIVKETGTATKIGVISEINQRDIANGATKDSSINSNMIVIPIQLFGNCLGMSLFCVFVGFCQGLFFEIFFCVAIVDCVFSFFS